MEIIINEANEIIDYAIVGGLEGGIIIDEVPSDFTDLFKPKFYIYENDQIKLNTNYKADEVEIVNNEPPVNTNISHDDLKPMIARLQKQGLNLSLKTLKLERENKALKAKIQKIEGGYNDKS